MNIVETAAGNPAFSRLVAALEAADLTTALAGTGPFTVFAPNDAAFAKLPAGTVDDLAKPGNKDRLSAILKLHVVPGRHMASEFRGKTADFASLGGETLHVSGRADGVHVGKARISTADQGASNGVIHTIDTVMMPA